MKSVVLYHCTIKAENVNGYMHPVTDEDIKLTHYYTVSLFCLNENGDEKITGGMILKTTLHHSHPEFYHMVEKACAAQKEFNFIPKVTICVSLL